MILPETMCFEKLQWANLRITLEERSGGLCEITGKGYDLVLHHIGGRDKPCRSWPKEIKEDWPHCELNTIIIRRGLHGSDERSGRLHGLLRQMAPCLWAFLRFKYRDRLYKGKTYAEWFEGPGPWE